MQCYQERSWKYESGHRREMGDWKYFLYELKLLEWSCLLMEIMQNRKTQDTTQDTVKYKVPVKDEKPKKEAERGPKKLERGFMQGKLKRISTKK